MGRLYTIGALIAIIGLGCWRYNYVVSDRDAQKLRAESAEAIVVLRDKALTTERTNAADADKRATDRQSEKEELQSDYDKKLKCINDGNCVVRMRYGSASCPTGSVHSPNTSTSGLDDIQVQDQRNLSEWVARVEHSAELDALAIEGFKKELAEKSKADYCKAK